jgi:hypothetical protein
VAIEGEGYTDKEFFKLRYKHLKNLGTPGLTKRSTVVFNDDLKKWENVWIIEYEVEDVPESPLVN